MTANLTARRSGRLRRLGAVDTGGQILVLHHTQQSDRLVLKERVTFASASVGAMRPGCFERREH